MKPRVGSLNRRYWQKSIQTHEERDRAFKQVRNKRGDITTDNTEIESILRGWNYIPTNCTTHRNGQIPRVNLPRLNHIKKQKV